MQRSITQTVISDGYPKAIIEVDASLGYLGKVLLEVDGKAAAEQFYFGQLLHATLGSTFIVHFENFYPENDHWFNYPRLRMVQISGMEFLHQTWALPHFQLFDITEVRAFLERLGVTAEPGWLVNRYVIVIGEAKKHELILFYLEPASRLGKPIEDLLPDGKAYNEWAVIERELTQTANRVFRFTAAE